MTFFNPIAGSLGQSDVVQRQTADKQRQIRRGKDREKNSALSSDKLDHQVESPDAIVEVHPDGHQQHDPRQRRKSPSQTSAGEDEARLDLTA